MIHPDSNLFSPRIKLTHPRAHLQRRKWSPASLFSPVSPRCAPESPWVGFLPNAPQNDQYPERCKKAGDTLWRGDGNNGFHTTSDTSGMSAASSSDLPCGRREVYHISWLFSMWLWLISHPRCCLVYTPGGSSRGVSAAPTGCRRYNAGSAIFYSLGEHICKGQALAREVWCQSQSTVFCSSSAMAAL